MTDSTQITKAKWTIMIYMAGDNNLSEDMLRQLKDLQESTISDDVKVVVQYDPNAEDISTQRYILKRGKINSIFESWDSDANKKDVRDESKYNKSNYEKNRSSNDTNTGSLWTLYDFMKWSHKKCPAEKYMLVIAGHSNSFVDGFMAIDQTSGDSLSLSELRYALYLGNKALGIKNLDILGFDSCLMCSAEVAYELRNHAKYLVGAEGFVLNAGWCHGKILSKLAKTPNVDPKEFAEIILETYLIHYFDYIATGTSVDFAILDLEQSSSLKQTVNGLANVLLSKLAKDASAKNKILLAHWEAQTYNDDYFIDIYDFCLMLERHFPEDTEIADVCKALKEAILGTDEIAPFVVKSCNFGALFQHSYGVSIHFPWARMLAKYIGRNAEKFDNQLDFLREPDDDSVYSKTKWREFVEEFLKLTRREKKVVNDSLQNLPGGVSRLHDWEVAHRSKDPLDPGPRLGSKNTPANLVASMKNLPQSWNVSPCLSEILEKEVTATNAKEKETNYAG